MNKDNVRLKEATISFLKEFIFFLENQDEEKSDLKFNEGDWIIDKEDGCVFQIIKVCDNTYEYKGITGNTYSCSHWSLENDARLWTIQDAKPGDIIYSTHNTESFEWIGIFKSLDKENKRVFFYGFWNNMAKSFSVCKNEAYVLYNDFSPVTKEQRDTLMEVMNDAGYTFDFEKKELKKIIDEKQIKKNLQDNSFHRMFEKKSWSEEDEKNLKLAIDNFQTLGNSFLTSWLKFLKDRVSTQPKQEWSVDDERTYRSVLYNFERHSPLNCVQQEFVKSHIQPQNKWNPSKEQIIALRWVLNNIPYNKHKEEISGLLDQIIKLYNEK